MDKLNFLTAGMPLCTPKPNTYKEAFGVLSEMELDGIELEFVHGVRMSEKSQELVKTERFCDNRARSLLYQFELKRTRKN